ncbi:MAG: hypothetical protein ABJ081_09435 [Hyphomicrobiales bacterium]
MTKKTAARPEVGIDSYIVGGMSNAYSKTLQMGECERLKLKKETAQYIHRMTADLCVMAAKADMEFLAYLIDMARIESYDRAHDQKLDEKMSVG